MLFLELELKQIDTIPGLCGGKRDWKGRKELRLQRAADNLARKPEMNQKNCGVVDTVKERQQHLGSNTEGEKWPHLSSSFTTLQH